MSACISPFSPAFGDLAFGAIMRAEEKVKKWVSERGMYKEQGKGGGGEVITFTK